MLQFRGLQAMSSQTEYERVEEELNEAKCPMCQGSGEVNDADLGDISYNTYKCQPCKGTGFVDGKLITLNRV